MTIGRKAISVIFIICNTLGFTLSGQDIMTVIRHTVSVVLELCLPQWNISVYMPTKLHHYNGRQQHATAYRIHA